jgi:NAD(P)-dependent dehydrogenase (short-subunit alcohol dehydrogenase family)
MRFFWPRRAWERVRRVFRYLVKQPDKHASNMNKVARDHSEALSKKIPARRIGSPEDMAGAAIFLASRAGDYVVGDTLVVDGGVAWGRTDIG